MIDIIQNIKNIDWSEFVQTVAFWIMMIWDGMASV